MGSTPTEELKAVAEQAKKVEFSEFTGDKLGAWKTDMGEEKFKRVTGNYSDKPNYTQNVSLGTADETYNKQPWEEERPDGTKVQRKAMWERWEGGSRSTWVDSDEQVRVELEDEGRDFCIATTSTGKALYQETMCRFGKTRENRWSPLIAGEERFFDAARSLPYSADFVENLSVKVGDDGKKTVERSLIASHDQWLGGPRDRYKKTVVTSNNGVVKFGLGEHGIMLGYTPPMNVVK